MMLMKTHLDRKEDETLELATPPNPRAAPAPDTSLKPS
jgi:hypothetical protein